MLLNSWGSLSLRAYLGLACRNIEYDECRLTMNI